MNDALFEPPVDYYDNSSVELVQHVGDDAMIAAAARVSLGQDMKKASEKSNEGLINYLMKSRHGSPFEHNALTFRVTAPIFVFREFQRHRIASYNEVSGRYKTLEPRFYVLPEGRPVVQSGSSAHPDLSEGTQDQMDIVDVEMSKISEEAWESYNYMLTAGVANEVARMVLPLNLFSDMYVTMNVRSLLNFIALRIDNPDNMYPTKPLYEIQVVARKMELLLEEHFPATVKAFNDNGRVAP